MSATLLILAHQDDEALSCGGLIQSRLNMGWAVSLITVFDRKYNYGVGPQYKQEQAKDWHAACSALGLLSCQFLDYPEGDPQFLSKVQALRELESACSRFKPVEIVLPDDQDMNQDHKLLNELGRILVRPWAQPMLRRVLFAQSPDGQPKISNYYVPMAPKQHQLKLDAVQSYAREGRTGAHPRSPQNLEAWHRQTGSLCGVEFAEPYRLHYIRE